MGLTKEQILDAKDLPSKKLAVPEWGGDVWLRTLYADERIAYEESVPDDKADMKNTLTRYIALVLVNEKGERLFTDEDAKFLGRKNPAVLYRVFVEAQKHNALTDDEVKAQVKN